MSKKAVEAADAWWAENMDDPNGEDLIKRVSLAVMLDGYARTMAIEAYCAAGARSHRWTPSEIGELAKEWWNAQHTI